MPKYHPHYVAVYVFVQKRDSILLLKRQNTGYRDGQYTVPSGHKEADEYILDAAVRETLEESGLTVQPEDLEHVHTMHRSCLDRDYIDFFFWTSTFTGEPKNMEPEKCSHVDWFPLDSLPAEFFDYLKDVITFKTNNTSLSERESAVKRTETTES